MIAAMFPRRGPISLTFLIALSLPLQAAHPLDPLSREEIAATREVLRSAGKLHETTRFASIDLDEPAKAEVLAFHGGNFPRRAFAILYERATNSTWEAWVDLRAGRLDSWKQVAGAQPPFLNEDYFLVQKIVRSDPRWRAAMAKRGISDLENVQLDPWTTGNFGWPEEDGKRIFRAVAFYKGHASNAYARPVEGLVATVDVSAMKVIKLTDTGVVPVAKASADFDEKSAAPLRGEKALRIDQPGGPGFTVEGNEVRWQKWRFRYGFHPREGLVLYTVGYEDAGRVRSILYRGSLSEMVVPYADPGTAWYFRNAFDEGEYGLGRMTGSLEPLTDAPANARFLDVYLNDDAGAPVLLERAAALYERDGGLLWKHLDPGTGVNQSRRARELVLTWIATVGNYDYGFNWIFHQDGRLEMEVDLTGIMETKGTGAEKEIGHRAHGNGSLAQKVAENVLAVNHQHFFNFRLDVDIDSPGGNRVVEMNTESVPPGPLNPQKNAFVMRETSLPTEKQAQRNLNLAANRCWEVLNPSRENALGEPVGYIFMPGENAIPYADPQSSVRRRAGFLNAQFWVTPYRREERYAAGDYINQNPGGEGLAKWTLADRSVEDTDVVVWYTLGVTHIPRPEDWPVMPVHRAGFQLMPAGFFSRNPALDVPHSPAP